MFESFIFRDKTFKNRFGMSALTRRRCDIYGTPTEMVKLYYTERAKSVGMIATECMPINDHCCPWPNAGVLYTQQAMLKWKEIVDIVHKENCLIFAQLFHGGRTVHPHFAKEYQPIAPSSLKLLGNRHTPDNLDSHMIPKEMDEADINQLKKDFKESILKANEAGFDGIELHSANGYLLDQFLRSSTNKRNDVYGGGMENRSRLLLELVDMAIELIGKDKIAVKLSPVGRMNNGYDENPRELLQYVLNELDQRGIMYVSIASAEPLPLENNGTEQMTNVVKDAKKWFKGGLIITDGYVSVEERFRRINEGEADIANFGKLLIANPNLPVQLKKGLPLNELKVDGLYHGGEYGYTDYPFVE